MINIRDTHQNCIEQQLLEWNISNNFNNMTSDQVENINREKYKNDLTKTLNEILDKDEIKELFMPWIESLNVKSKLSSVEKDNLLLRAMEESNIFEKNKENIVYAMVNIVEKFNSIDMNNWNEEDYTHIYDNFKIAIHKYFDKTISLYTDVVPENYNKLQQGKSPERGISRNAYHTRQIPNIDNVDGLVDKLNYDLIDDNNFIDDLVSWKKTNYDINWGSGNGEKIDLERQINIKMLDLQKDLKIISAYISVADGDDDTQKFKELFDKYREFYDNLKKLKKEIINKKTESVQAKTNESLRDVIAS